MKPFHLLGASLAAGCLAIALASPAAASDSAQEAENVRKLDIMLMVSSLRCRYGAYDFRADYQRFSERHMPTLTRAYDTLHRDFARVHGHGEAKRALDRISVGMANQYGQGHPWLDCSDLREATRDLAERASGQDLYPAAMELLSDGTGSYLAARR